MRPGRAGGKDASIGYQSATIPAAGVSKNYAFCVVLGTRRRCCAIMVFFLRMFGGIFFLVDPGVPLHASLFLIELLTAGGDLSDLTHRKHVAE